MVVNTSRMPAPDGGQYVEVAFPLGNQVKTIGGTFLTYVAGSGGEVQGVMIQRQVLGDEDGGDPEEITGVATSFIGFGPGVAVTFIDEAVAGEGE
jgi:hypothetical protein